MKTILDEGDEVKFKSYCLKHSKNKLCSEGEQEDSHKPVIDNRQSESEKTSLRAQKLKELEEEFYTMVNVDAVAAELGVPKLTVDLIYSFWLLKRKSNFNKPLVPPKEEEQNGLLQPKEDSIHTRMRMFMHLRQDLERVSLVFTAMSYFFLKLIAYENVNFTLYIACCFIFKVFKKQGRIKNPIRFS